MSAWSAPDCHRDRQVDRSGILTLRAKPATVGSTAGNTVTGSPRACLKATFYRGVRHPATTRDEGTLLPARLSTSYLPLCDDASIATIFGRCGPIAINERLTMRSGKRYANTIGQHDPPVTGASTGKCLANTRRPNFTTAVNGIAALSL